MSAVGFNLEKKKVRQSFASAANSYDGFALLQRQIGLDLITRFDINIANKAVMDVGCGTGFLIQQLMSGVAVQRMIAVDVAWSMLQRSRIKLKHLNNIQYVCADAENLPFSNRLIDQVISNLALQWCRDLPIVFNGFKQVLKPGGQLLFATFGTETLQELKQSWSQVDSYTHVNEFYTVDDINRFLEQSEFKNVQIESHCYYSSYSSVMALMKELKGIGANHVMLGRNQKITGRCQMQAMIDTYERFRVNGLIPATYEVIFVSADI